MTKPYNSTYIEDLFRDYLVSENKSQVTISNYQSDIRQFLDWLRATESFRRRLNTRIDELSFSKLDIVLLGVIESKDIVDYLTYVSGKYHSNSEYVRRYYYSLKSFCIYCSDRAILDKTVLLGFPSLGSIITDRKEVEVDRVNTKDIEEYLEETSSDSILFDSSEIQNDIKQIQLLGF